MIQTILGKRGSGKTKRIIDMANDALKTEHGDVVFMDDDDRYMYDLRHQIRFINAMEYELTSPDMFFGFISGILAQNFDVTKIFIDAFKRLAKAEPHETESFFERLEALSQKRKVDFVISVSGDPDDMPEYIRKYAI